MRQSANTLLYRLLPAAAASAALAGAPSILHAAVLLDDTFSDSERATQSLPTSAKWTVGAHQTSGAFGTLNASSGKLVLDHTNATNSFAATWAHFTASGSPTSLEDVGDQITLSFDVSFSGGVFVNSTGAFRFALFNSGGTRVTTDFAGSNESGISSGATFSGWRGYEGQTPIFGTTVGTAGSNDFLTRERTGSGNGLFTSSNWTAQTAGAVLEPVVVANTTYAGSLTVTRAATGVNVQATFAGATTNTFLDSATPRTLFDTVTFFTLDGNTHNLTLDNVKVEFVPEPASISLLGIAGIALLKRRRA